jgi:hypothetical protein
MSETPRVGERWFVANSNKESSRVHVGVVLALSPNLHGYVVVRMRWYDECVPVERLLAKLTPWHVRLWKAVRRA